MKVKFTLTLITMLTICLIGIQAKAQKAFLGGGGNASMPVVNYENYNYHNSLFGGHTGQVKYVVASADGNYLYFESYDQWTAKRKIYKVDAITQEYLGQLAVINTAYDLEISDDNAYLFFHSFTKLYKLNTATMMMEDSITLPSFSFIEVYDNNTVFCSSLDKIQVVDFTTGATTEIPTSSGGHNDMAFNSDKSKLYTLKASPHKIIILDVNSLTIETDINIEGTTGLPWDIALDQDDQYIYTLFSGVNGTEGTLRVLNASDLSTVIDIPTPEGYGKLAKSPDQKLWVPAGTSSEIAIVDMASNTLETVLNTNDFNNFYGPYTIAFSNATITGLNENRTQSSIEIYPNPSNGFFSIESKVEIKSIEIITMNGIVMGQYETGLKNQRIDFNGPEGAYIVKITDTDGNTQNTTIMVNK